MGAELEPIPEVAPSSYWGDERASYDRLDGESLREFGWFQHYARTGRKRSYKETSAFMEVSRDAVQRAATKHSWRVRVEAFDDEEDSKKLREIEARQIETRAGHAELLGNLRSKVDAAIALMDPYRTSSRDLPAMVEVLIKYERLTMGISDAPKRVEITGKDGGAIEVSAADMTPEQRQQVMAQIMAELAKRQAEVEALAEANILEGEIVPDGEG